MAATKLIVTPKHIPKDNRIYFQVIYVKIFRLLLTLIKLLRSDNNQIFA
ncbi:hypothetical protein GFK82_00592 [Candidatus Steffania adelgidicola]|nr:hypothetical protein GFK82_00592 [Candidatus Steffania adelgidicola]